MNICTVYIDIYMTDLCKRHRSYTRNHKDYTLIDMHSQWLKYIQMMVPVFSKTSRALLGKR